MSDILAGGVASERNLFEHPLFDLLREVFRHGGRNEPRRHAMTVIEREASSCARLFTSPTSPALEVA